MNSFSCLWVFVIIFLGSRCDASPMAQRGLFDELLDPLYSTGGLPVGKSLTQTNGLNTNFNNFNQNGRNLNHQNMNTNSLMNQNKNNLFWGNTRPNNVYPQRPNGNTIPQRPNPTNHQHLLDPDTRNKLTEQKGQLEDLLEKLKGLEKKNEEKQKNSKETGDDANVTNNNSGKLPDNNDNHHHSRPAEPINETPVGDNGGWKKFTVRKFEFQVQPVTPDDNNDELTETVYYLD